MKPQTTNDIIYVSLQLILFLAFVLDIDLFILPVFLPDFILGFLMGLSIYIFLSSIVLLNKNLSPFPSPTPKSTLIKKGVFKYIRHPIYSAIILGMLCWSMYNNSGYQITITFLTMGLFFFKSKYEEKLLVKTHKDYVDYMKRTGRFIPGFFN